LYSAYQDKIDLLNTVAQRDELNGKHAVMCSEVNGSKLEAFWIITILLCAVSVFTAAAQKPTPAKPAPTPKKEEKEEMFGRSRQHRDHPLPGSLGSTNPNKQPKSSLRSIRT
jgi:hypothetical protein